MLECPVISATTGRREAPEDPRGHVERQAEPPDQPPQDDHHRGETDDRILEDDGQRDRADEHQRDAAERAEHARARRHPLQPGSDQRAHGRDDAAHEARADADLPGENRVVGRPVDRPDHPEEVDEHHRGGDAVGQGGHVAPGLRGGALGQPDVDGDAGNDRHGRAGHDAAVDDLGRHLEHELTDTREHHQVDQVVGEQRPEGAEVLTDEQAVTVSRLGHGSGP
jgi:hypothetical protein